MSEFFSIEGAFAYYTESNLATLEYLQALASSSKSARQRQKDICDGMVRVCRDFGIEPNRTNIRLSKALLQLQEQRSTEPK